jgi:hypothetical protein
MNYSEAIKEGHNGAKIKLPEWNGYWFWDGAEMKVMTREGDVIGNPYTNDYKNRTDWEITDGSRDFGGALIALKAGKLVARKGWNGKGIYIELQRPDENSKMTHPYIFIDTTGLKTNNPDAPKSRVPWLASQTDLLAMDWVLV